MNKKEPDRVKSYPIMIRLTKEESIMAKELRTKFDINISSFVRNAIRKEWENRSGESND